jgi:hypothetical protein
MRRCTTLRGTKNVVEWPAVRDVMRDVGISQAYVSRLIKAGRLHAVKTRLGWLLDPDSVAAFQAERAARLRARTQ